jgi:nucleotide-binding universal stress UspA family protein
MARAAAEVKAPRRVVVLLDASAPGRAALEAAAAHAAELEAELVAVFVEDVDLLHLAGLPFAREIGFPSAERRELDASSMERALHQIAEEARRSIAELAERRPLQWSFQIVRGDLSAQMLAAAAEADLVIDALCGCERAGLQLAGVCRESEHAKLLRARTHGELEKLLRELQRRD